MITPEFRCHSQLISEFTKRKKPSGKKQERRQEKLPNQIRHDNNAAIATGTWKNRGVNKKP